MTLLLVIISITNIAIGYWLAIHLGHAQAPWAAKSLNRVKPPAEPPAIAAEALTAEVEVEPVPAAPLSEPPVAEEPVPEVAETAEVAAEEEVLNTVEEVRAEIHDQPAPATIVEALAGEAESETADSKSEEAPAKSKPVSKEALLESIGAFQEQLKKQRELSNLQAASGAEQA